MFQNTAQEYIKDRRKDKTIKKLDISYKGLKGHLDLNDFVNLEELDCSYNELTSLDISSCNKLVTVLSSNNFLTDIRLPFKSERLENLQLGNNNFPVSDLSRFSNYTNLNDLRIGTDDREKIERNIYNRFCGSLESLKNLTNLRVLGVSNTDIDSGLEYLPDSLKTIYCYNLCRKEVGCWKILNGLNNIQDWRKSNSDLIIARWKKETWEAQKEIASKQQKIQELEEELILEREEAEEMQKRMDNFYRKNPPRENIVLQNILSEVNANYLETSKKEKELEKDVQRLRKQLEIAERIVEQEYQIKIEIPPKK